jgi:hypothetical protein
MRPAGWIITGTLVALQHEIGEFPSPFSGANWSHSLTLADLVVGLFFRWLSALSLVLGFGLTDIFIRPAKPRSELNRFNEPSKASGRGPGAFLLSD